MFIFEKDKYFKECHAVSAVRLDNGDFIVTWFGGSHEGKADVDIWASRMHNQIWTKPEKIISDEMALWNPVLFYDSGVLTLFFRRGEDIGSWRSYMMFSKDNGKTYSEPEALPEGFMGPIKNKPIRMSNGEWLCGSSLEPEWESIIEIYSPEENSWLGKSILKSPDDSVNSGIIQPTLWESSPGKVHAIMRSSLLKLFRADSNDYGRTWNEPYPIDLPSNNSGVDLAKLPGGELVLAYNPIAENWGKRSPLILSMSLDNGKTWLFHYTLEKEEPQYKDNRYAGRYSYPAVIAVPDGVACFYTHCRNRIKYQIVTTEQIKNGNQEKTELHSACAG